MARKSEAGSTRSTAWDDTGNREEDDMRGSNLIWTIVGILAIIALGIFIFSNV